MTRPVILMTGVTGLIGRWTAAALTGKGVEVLALTRNAAAREAALKDWVAVHGGEGEKLRLIEADLSADPALLEGAVRPFADEITHIYSFAALMEWGLDVKAARRVNVESVETLLGLAKTLPRFERFVHITGYMLSAPPHRAALGYDMEKLLARPQKARRFFAGAYKKHGAYEISKTEADFTVRLAAREGLPVTLLHPATVLGHSETGEAHQHFGIEGFADGLAAGMLTAIPGKPGDWAPFVSIDYLARFAAEVPLSDTAMLEEYVLLDQNAPPLARTVAVIAGELGVKAPKAHIPVWMLRMVLKAGMEKRLGTSAETLAFINAYRFDTASADAAAARIGLSHAPVEEVLRKTVRYRAERQRRAERGAA